MDDVRPPTPTRPNLTRRSAWASLALAALALPLGCSSAAPDRAEGRVLSPRDFADPDAPPTTYQNVRAPLTPPPDASPAIDLAPPPNASLDLVTSPGAPSPSAGPVAAAGRAEFVDAKVGDINGRPIYANAFLDPMADRLRAEGERLNRANWRRFAQAQIRRELDGLLRDELLRAEAVSSLTPEQQQGLRAFLQTFREDLVSRNLGSQTLAAKRVEEETGQSLEESLREQEELTLVRLEFQRVINKRVNVSWRDVELRYEQDAEKYNPDPVARFRLIRVRTSDEQGVAAVRDALASGLPFAQVASDAPNGFNPDTGGLHEAQFKGDFEHAEFWAVDALNERARTLRVGQVTGPFEFGSFTGWMTLEEIVDEKVDLYEAQRQIYNELLNERRNEELTRYIQRLIERANVSGIEEIEQRLLEIAERRYAPTP
ncbi:MAG: hypothetical protein ACIARR_04050 [Phycisphaerales bacterium JB059]